MAHVYAYATKLVLSYGFELKLNHGQEAFTHLVMVSGFDSYTPWHTKYAEGYIVFVGSICSSVILPSFRLL